MLTRDEAERLGKWVDDNTRWDAHGQLETWQAFIRRGLTELGLIEREPTAKEKYEKAKKTMPTMKMGCELFFRASDVNDLVCLADAAIKEAEERK